VIEYSIDRERTEAAFRDGVLRDKRSHYNLLGHVFLRGVDREAQWEQLYLQRGGKCEVCGTKLRRGEADMNHLGKTTRTRCDCLCQPLNDGETTCTGIQLICTMDPRKGGGPDSCHAKYHNREIGGRK
jgi:hypothetical protein